MKAFEEPCFFRKHVLSDVLPHLHDKNDNAHKLFFTSSQNSTLSLIRIYYIIRASLLLLNNCFNDNNNNDYDKNDINDQNIKD